MHLVTQELVGMYSEFHAVVMPANPASVLQPVDQGGISTLKSYYLRNTLCEATPTIDNDSSDGSGQSRLSTSGSDSPF